MWKRENIHWAAPRMKVLLWWQKERGQASSIWYEDITHITIEDHLWTHSMLNCGAAGLHQNTGCRSSQTTLGTSSLKELETEKILPCWMMFQFCSKFQMVKTKWPIKAEIILPCTLMMTVSIPLWPPCDLFEWVPAAVERSMLQPERTVENVWKTTLK